MAVSRLQALAVAACIGVAGAAHASVHITTFVPGSFFGFSNAIMAVDNPRIAVVPAPGALAMMGLSVATLRRRRR